jgi:hypothetical protein
VNLSVTSVTSGTQITKVIITTVNHITNKYNKENIAKYLVNFEPFLFHHVICPLSEFNTIL